MPNQLLVFGLIVAFLGLLIAFGVVRRRYFWITSGHPGHWWRARQGKGLTVEELAKRMRVPASELESLEPKYRESFIPKRSGKAMRRLSIPDDRTRPMQQRVLWRGLSRLRAHPAACGFEQGRSIVDNARAHVAQAVVVRLDIVDFFPSTNRDRLELYFRRIGWNAEAAALLVKLTTYENGLPQGAPTSPRLSNLVNYRMDVLLAKAATRRKGVYTRYADDLTFSFPKDYPKRMRSIVQKTGRILKLFGYKLHTDRKLRILRSHQRQQVTGLVVNEKLQLPRATRRWLRAVRHHAATGRPCSLSPAQLEGWNALEKMIETQRDQGTANQQTAPRS